MECVIVEFFVYCCLYTVKFCLSVMCKIYDCFIEIFLAKSGEIQLISSCLKTGVIMW